MTTPFSSASFPSNPTVPTQAPAGYTTPTTPPNPDAINPPVSSEQMDSLRGNLLEMVLRQVVQALVGAFVPGAESAFDQLAAWAANIPVIGPLITALTGIINGDLTDLENWSQGIPSNVVDSVALDPGKFFAEAANVTGLTALWVNTVQPWLTSVFGSAGVIVGLEHFVNGILGVTDNPTGSSSGSLVQSTAGMVTSTASDLSAQASSATQNAVTSALTAGSPSATSPIQNFLSGIGQIVSLPPWLTDFAASLTPTLPGAAAAVSNTASHLVAAPVAAVQSAASALPAAAATAASNAASNLFTVPTAVQEAAAAAPAAAASAVSNTVTNFLAAPAAAVQSAAAAVDGKLAPAKGLGGEVSSVAENLLGLISNPSGSAGGSLVSAVISQLTSSAGSGSDILANITSTLTQAITDAAGGSLAQADIDISTRFGNSSVGTLLTDIVGILANPSGSASGSIPQGIWDAFWKFINCNGLTGKGFSAGNNLTGLLDNPTGSSSGTPVSALVGYVTDLAKTLFGNGGAGLKQLGELAQALVTGNICALIGDFFNGTFATAAEVLNDVSGILGFFSNPSLPSPTDLATGAQSAAGALIGAAAGAIGLGNTSGGLSGSVANVISDFMTTLGNPNGLGTGNVTLNALESIPILGPLIEALFSALGGNGAASTGGLMGLLDEIPLIGPLLAQLPSMLTGIFGPGSSPSLLPDPDFSTMFGTDVDGQGMWTWAWPGPDLGAWGSSSGCIRTVRPGLTTVYFVPGTWEILPGHTSFLIFESGGTINETDPLTFLQALASSTGEFSTMPTTGDNLLDWSRFEFIMVPFGAATYPMGQTAAEGTANLTSMINNIPGKFVIVGHSQGGLVVSNVYDSLRTGALQSRNDDMLMGVGIGNMRRQKGTSFPGAASFCPDGEGCYTPLAGCESRWWEWSVAAGTYPGNGTLDGVTFPAGDPASCLGDDATGAQIRNIISTTMKATSINFLTAVEEFFQLLLTSGGRTLEAGLASTAPHNVAHYQVQPFLAQGDTRNFWEIMFDAINELPSEPQPGLRHFIESTPFTVHPGSVVKAGADVEWINFNLTGPAIVVGVNVYDVNGTLLETDQSFRDQNGNTIISMASFSTTVRSPQAASAWQTLVDSFTMPAGAATATLAFDVEPDAMTTGVAAFGKGVFQITSGVIDASQLGNMGNIPTVDTTSVAGIQGMTNQLSTWQHTLDGLTSAFTGTSVTDVAISDVIHAASGLTSAASTSLKALPSINSRLAALESAAGITPPPTYQGPEQSSWSTANTYAYDIPAWMVAGDLLDVVALGAGGAGMGDVGGGAGSWTGKTLVYGTDFPLATTELTVVVGARGGTASTLPFVFPGSFGGAGDGAASSVSDGSALVTTAGGSAGGSTSSSGAGPGSFAWNGKLYAGGPPVAAEAVGGAPGGGGGAGGSLPSDEAAPGADGFVSIIAYQSGS